MKFLKDPQVHFLLLLIIAPLLAIPGTVYGGVWAPLSVMVSASLIGWSGFRAFFYLLQRSELKFFKRPGYEQRLLISYVMIGVFAMIVALWALGMVAQLLFEPIYKATRQNEY